MFQDTIKRVRQAETIGHTGKIENIVGMSIEASGGRAAVGDICRIYSGESGGQIPAEVVGFKNIWGDDRNFLGEFCKEYRPAAPVKGGPVPKGAHYKCAGAADR